LAPSTVVLLSSSQTTIQGRLLLAFSANSLVPVASTV